MKRYTYVFRQMSYVAFKYHYNSRVKDVVHVINFTINFQYHFYTMLCVLLLMNCPDSVYKLVFSIGKEDKTLLFGNLDIPTYILFL